MASETYSRLQGKKNSLGKRNKILNSYGSSEQVDSASEVRLGSKLTNKEHSTAGIDAENSLNMILYESKEA